MCECLVGWTGQNCEIGRYNDQRTLMYTTTKNIEII